MQLGGIRLSPTERQRRIINRLCLYCGAAGHFASSCQLKPELVSRQGSTGERNCSFLPPKTRTTFPAVLRWAGFSVSCSALIDSGAEGNFIDERWAREHDIPLVDLEELLVFALDGRVLSTVHHVTIPVSLTVSGNHQETISFYIFQSPFTPIVLGHPWLTQHNPQINWDKGIILSWKLLVILIV